MSSLGKSIGRIQSAPPDEGEPDLKAHLNLNAAEFSPSTFGPKVPISSKGLSAQANDFVPDTGKGSSIPLSQPYRAGHVAKPYNKYPQSSYSMNYQNSYNYTYQHTVQPHYTNQHNYHHQTNVVNSTPFIPQNVPSGGFNFSADTPSFEMAFLAKDSSKLNEIDFTPAQSVTKISAGIDVDLSFSSVKEERKDEPKIEEKKHSEDNLIKDTKLQDIVFDMQQTIKELEKINEEVKDKEEEIVDEKITLESPVKTDIVIEPVTIEGTSNGTQDSIKVSEPNNYDSPKAQSPSLKPDPSTPSPPPLPQRRVYDLETIKNFKLDFSKDPNFINVPEQIMKFRFREVEEVRIQKNRKNQEEKRITREVTQKLIWRKAKTAEEQKISEKAKAYTRKFTATVAEQEKIKKEIKSTLNKLSPNNLGKLIVSITDTCKKSHDCLKLVVSGIFEKAWSEKKYTQMYSDICKTLKSSMEGYRYPDIDPSKLPDTRNYFKYELLYMCEETFNKNHQEEIPVSLTEEQKLDRLKKLKEKTLGNVRFIGELFNVNLITAKIVLECVTGLLDLFESENNQDRLEGACLLLHTGGATFERSKVLQETNRIYERLTAISNMDITTKNKFKIMDLKEFRETGWKVGQNEGLKKVEEIHADHMMEQEEIKRRHGYNN